MPQSKTILIVDDDPDVRYLCQSILEAEGYRVHTAEDGQEGVELAEKVKPDLIVLDIIMERINSGYTVAEKLGRRFPIILFSSITNESDQVFDPEALPVRAVVSKPVERAKLLDKVREVLGA